MSKWTYNEHEDDTWYYGFYESREEAIAAGMEEAKEFGWGKTAIVTGKQIGRAHV